MADETAPVETTQADVIDPAQAATTQATETSTPADDGKTVTLAKHQEEVGKKNSEAKALRERATKAESELKKLTDAQLSDTEKLTKRVEEAEAKAAKADGELRNFHVREAVTNAARDPKLGARKPENLYKLVNADAITIENGKVSGLDAELKRVKEEFPEMFVEFKGNANAGAGGGGIPENADMNELIRRQAGIMPH